MRKSRKCSKSMSGTQTRQNSEIVSQRSRGKLGTCRIRTPSIEGRRMYGTSIAGPNGDAQLYERWRWAIRERTERLKAPRLAKEAQASNEVPANLDEL